MLHSQGPHVRTLLQALEAAPTAQGLAACTRELPPASSLWAVSQVSLSTDRYLADPTPHLLYQLSWLDLRAASSLKTHLLLNCSTFLVWLLQDHVLDGESFAAGWPATTHSSQAIFPWWNSPLVQRKSFSYLKDAETHRSEDFAAHKDRCIKKNNASHYSLRLLLI